MGHNAFSVNLIWLVVEMCASFLRTVLIGCEDDLEVNATRCLSSTFDISTQLELCLWSWNVSQRMELYDGMLVKEWSYLRHFIIGGDDSRPQDVVRGGKSMLSGERLLCTWYHTCIELRGCWWTICRWSCCRSGESVKMNVHEDNQFYDMMVEAMAND